MCQQQSTKLMAGTNTKIESWIKQIRLWHTSCEDALKEKKISEQTTGQALFWTYFCIRICVEANDLATSKQGLVYITI